MSDPSPDPFNEPADPPPAPKTTEAPPAVTPLAAPNDSLYSAEDLAAAWQSLGIQPWDAPAIFTQQGVTEMTLADFETALAQWRSPLTPEIAPEQ